MIAVIRNNSIQSMDYWINVQWEKHIVVIRYIWSRDDIINFPLPRRLSGLKFKSTQYFFFEYKRVS